MTSLSMKTHPALFCGILLFFCVETRSEVATDENNINTTVDAVSMHVSKIQGTTSVPDKPLEDVRMITTPHVIMLPTVVNTDRVTTATSNDNQELPHGTAAVEEQPAHSASVSRTEKPTDTEESSTTAHTTSPFTAVPKTEVKSFISKPKNETTPETSPATEITLPPESGKSPITDTVSATSVTELPAALTTTPETARASETGSPPISGKSTIKGTLFPETVTNSSTLSPQNNTTLTTETFPVSETNASFHQNTTTALNSTSESAFEFNTHNTSSPIGTAETHMTTSATSGPPPVPHTTSISTSASSDESNATEISSTDSSTTEISTSAGALIPIIPKKLPLPTSKANSTKVTESPPSPEAQPCLTRGMVKQCLIVIASLAVLAAIFIISTIVLCTKLSARKYRVKKQQQGTEMMCISALLPERNYNYTRQRNPVPNGVLVIPTCGDSDDEVGDNLTLSSFLPENDRYV